MQDIADIFRDLSIRDKKRKIRIGVIAGGISAEREISLKTGTKVFEALKDLGYRVKFVDFKDGFTGELKNIDIAFLALHGRYGEDGTIQGMLELLKIPYTGSGVLSSAVVIDKVMTKKLLQCEGIKTPPYEVFDTRNPAGIDYMDSRIVKDIGYPVIVKPNREGSTIGVTIADGPAELEEGIREAGRHDHLLLVEKFIKGRELTASILGGDPVALPIIEIKPKSGFYDYNSKYTVNMTEYIVPAQLAEEISYRINDIGLRCHEILGCSAISRTDFILDAGGTPHVLEINTMPGMTPTSLVPKAARAAGISFGQLVEIILNYAGLKI
ncbi:MAG: D-alanine--D-alanine ligase [Actinomycetota bacterium]